MEATYFHKRKLAPSLDHIVPRKLGGDKFHANKLYAHVVCNNTRGAKPLNHKERLRAKYYRLAAIAFTLGKE